MKRIFLTTLATLMISVPALAEDGGSVMYIPGMPVPQQTQAAPAASPSSTASGEAGKSDSGNIKVSKVSKAGELDMGKPAPAAEPEVFEPVYKGVTPPKRLVPENESTFTRDGGNQLSWIGFMPEEESHRIFIQTSTATTYERVASAADRVELLLSNTKLSVSNNNRELDMSYFKTPFSKAKATSQGNDVKVVVQLKEAVPCEIQQHENFIEIIVKDVK